MVFRRHNPDRPRQRARPGRAPRVAAFGGLTALAVALAVSSGCATTHGQAVAFLKAYENSRSTGEYVAYPPDVITIHAAAAPEIDGVTQTIRADGKIVLRLLGEIDVAGLTTTAMADKIRRQLSRYYVDPEVVVEIAGYRSQYYYIFGEVSAPGARPYTGHDTLLKALADAHPTFLAWRQQIRIVRPSANRQDRKIITVDLDRMIHTGEADQNVLLQAGDLVEVPPTPLAWVGQRVRELLYPIAPAVQTYVQPASTIEATEVYEGDSTGNDASWRNRLLP
jgi:polysaccharide export outer membrane protein